MPNDDLLSVHPVPLGEGVTRLVVRGEIDPATAPHVEAALADAGRGGDAPTRVELDLAGVTFIDSAGLRVLIAACRPGSTPEVVLRSPSPTVQRILDLTGLTGQLPIDGDGGS